MNVLFFSCTVNYDRIFLLDFDLAGTTQLTDGRFFQFQADFFRNNLAACQYCDVLKHGFPTITKAGGFDGNTGERAAQLIDNQGCQCFAFNIFSDDQQFFAFLNDFFEQWQNVLDVCQFLIGDQDVRIVDDRFHFIHVSRHIGRNITAIKLHSFNNFKFCAHGLGFFNRDNTVGCNPFHRIGNQFANIGIIGRNRGDAGDVFFTFHNF